MSITGTNLCIILTTDDLCSLDCKNKRRDDDIPVSIAVQKWSPSENEDLIVALTAAITISRN